MNTLVVLRGVTAVGVVEVVVDVVVVVVSAETEVEVEAEAQTSLRGTAHRSAHHGVSLLRTCLQESVGRT